MIKYQCPVCKKIEWKKGWPNQTGHVAGTCVHGDMLIFMEKKS